MKISRRRLFSIALAAALAVAPPSFVSAEDIDLFTGTTASVGRPNVLFIIDNSANWAQQAQHWTDDLTQGQSELRALRDLIGNKAFVNENINVGLMMLTAGQGVDSSSPGYLQSFSGNWANQNGGYVRFAIRQMTDDNRKALQELIGDGSCTDGPNSLNGTNNCIYKNASGNSTLNESVGTNVDYSGTMFEAFKYFGGWTDPTNAKTDIGWGGDPAKKDYRDKFGALRYSGVPLTTPFIRTTKDVQYDFAAFVPLDDQPVPGRLLRYQPPIDSSNNCAKNYIIFIGNGFPNQDAPSTLLSGVQPNLSVADATKQLSMFKFSTTTTNTTPALAGLSGSTCTTSNNTCPSLAATLFPGHSTYTCATGASTTAAGCTGQNRKDWDVFTSDIITTTAPTTLTYIPPVPGTPIRFADEWAAYLNTTDVNSTPGQQNVITYTIDVFKDQPDANQNSLLLSMARDPARYFQAKSEKEIAAAFEKIVIEIQAQNSVFAAASLPVSATNRTQNENQVFFGLFRPDANALPRWYGNLKRYQVAKDATTGQLILADANGSNAINPTTGFFDDCATSFWTSDSGSYWSYTNASGACPLPATPPPSSVFSDLPDGPLVEKGGAAEVVRRGNNPASPTTAENRTIFTCTSTASCPPGAMVAFNTTNVTPTALGLAAGDTATQTKIVNYTRGQDVNDENANGNTTETRGSIHGDVVHSRPLPVNYDVKDPTTGVITSNGGVSVGVVDYYGSNDGMFRAVRSTDGTELWSFVAPEYFTRLKRLVDNNQLIAYPNVLAAAAAAAAAGTPYTPPPAPKDYFFDGSIGLFQTADNSKIWIFPTMRRGGRMLYAFDVTTPPNVAPAPKLLWRVGCPNLGDDTGCTTSFTGIGQTWSTPNIATIKSYNSGNSHIIVVGGGYDSCEDTDSATTTCPTDGSEKGAKVYVLDASNGALLATFDTERAVPADVALVDRDFDGHVDAGYVADTGGNLYRIDFINQATKATLSVPGTATVSNSCPTDGSAPTVWCITKIANTSGASRKFLFAPSVLPTSDRVFVTIGSGDRERPLLSNYPYQTSPSGVVNRFYMFMDRFPTGSVGSPVTPANLDDTTMMVDITSAPPPSCIDPSSTTNGWFTGLSGGRGEQVVTSSLITGGNVFFNTNRALPSAPGTCNTDLGEARGYGVSLLCGAQFYNIFQGGGLPISPVQGTTTLADGAVVTFCEGCANPNVPGGTTNPYTPGQIKPVIAPVRSRLYWYRKGDQ